MIWLVAFLSCIGLICAKPPPINEVDNSRVIGGEDASRNTWKWQVSLQLGSFGFFSHICGGSILNSYHIMTAAHCILSSNPREYRVVAGEYNLDRNEGTEQFMGVEKIIIHPGWTGNLGIGNDIAILKLAQPVHHNGYIEFARLPYADQTLPNGFNCYITGWGSMDDWGNAPSVLQVAMLPVVEHSICSTHSWWGSLARETMVCAGGDGVVSGCQGDSGGPLNCFIDGVWTVQGVVSYGPSGMCNQYQKPTVFTRVSSFVNWIISVCDPW